MATKKTKKTPTKENEKKNSSDEVIISAPREPITPSPDMVTQTEISGISEPDPPKATPQIDVFTTEFCGTLWDMLFSRLAATKGDHWKLTEAEKMTIGETTSVCANRYIGEMLGEYPELAALGISVAVITVPRVLKDGKIKQTAKQLANRSISEVGVTDDPSVSSILTAKEQPSDSSG